MFCKRFRSVHGFRARLPSSEMAPSENSIFAAEPTRNSHRNTTRSEHRLDRDRNHGGTMKVSSTTRRKLLGNMFWLYALQGLNYVIPLAVLPYLVRVLGIEGYGLIAFAQAFAQYFVILTDYGFNLSATKRIALARDNRQEVSRIFWSVILVKTLLMLLGALVMGAIVLSIPRFRADAPLYAIAYIAVVGSVLFPLWLFQGMEQMR